MEYYNNIQKDQKLSKKISNSGTLGTFKVFLFFALGILISGLMAFFYPFVFAFLIADSYQAYFISLAVFAVLYLLSSLLPTFGYVKQNSILTGIGYFISAISFGGLISVYTLFLDTSILATALLVTGGMFLIAGIIGVLFKGKLYKTIGILSAGMIALMVLVLISFFFYEMTVLDWIISILGVIIFTLWAAIDINRVVKKGENLYFNNSNSEALYEAFVLYTDFASVFVYVLRLILILSQRNRN